MPDDRFISVDEAKQQLCLGTTSIYDFINSGQLRRIKLGRKTVFLQSDVEAFMLRKVAEAKVAPRHAALAVNLAGSMALFMIETAIAREWNV